MARTKISEFSTTPGDNTDIDGINIAEGCPPSGINDAIRELMAQLKDFQSGAAGDSITVVGTLAAKGTSSAAGDLKLYEDTDNGTNYVGFIAPASIASNVQWTLPSADGSSGQALQTNASGTLSFATLGISAGGTGQTTANSALNALLPSQTSANGRYLKSDGTNASWDLLDISTADITGTLPVANGGTGVTSSTGTGSVVLSNSPTLVTPALGTPSSATLTNATGLPLSTGVTGTLPIANGGTGQTTANAAFNSLAPSQTGNSGKYLTTDGTNTSWASAASGTVTSVDVSGGTTGLTTSGGPITSSGTITFAGTLATTNGGTGLTSLGTGVQTAFSQSVTGSGGFVLATSPTLTTPNLGTPSAVTLTNATGLPVSTGISGLGTNVATALAVNVGSSGAFVTNGGALGTPSSGTLTNATGLPISTGVSGLGTNVATALAVNVGSSGAFVTNGGALGTPSSGTVTNLTGTASININGTVGATTPTTGAFTTLTTSSTVTHNGGTADQVQYLNASKVLSGSSNFTFDGSNLQIGSQGDLRFGDSDNSNWVGFQAPASVTTNITWTLPSADGSNGQVLSTNGSGTLSWTTAGGGGGISAGKSIAFAMVFGG